MKTNSNISKPYTLVKEIDLAVDRQGRMYETVAFKVKDNSNNNILCLSIPEVKYLVNTGILDNYTTDEDGSIYPQEENLTLTTFSGAIICGLIPENTREQMGTSVVDYLTKVGFISNTPKPLEMKAGTKYLSVNSDGTYDIKYVWKNITRENLDALNYFSNYFFKNYASREIDKSGVILRGLSSQNVFCTNFISEFQKFDANVKMFQTPRTLLLRALLNRAFIDDFPANILYWTDFSKEGTPLAISSSWTPTCGTIRIDENLYWYNLNVPYNEDIKKLMQLTCLLLQRKGITVFQDEENCSFGVITNEKTVASELEVLDIAIEVLLGDRTSSSEYLFSHAILKRLEIFSEKGLIDEYHDHLKELNLVFPKKAYNP